MRLPHPITLHAAHLTSQTSWLRGIRPERCPSCQALVSCRALWLISPLLVISFAGLTSRLMFMLGTKDVVKKNADLMYRRGPKAPPTTAKHHQLHIAITRKVCPSA